MKTVNLRILASLFIAFSLLFTACDDDSDGDDSSENNTGVVIPDDSNESSLTAEQHKTNLESEGVAFVNKMDAMADLEVVSVIMELESLLSSEDAVTTSAVSRINALIADPKQTTGVKSINAEGDISLEELFSSVAGVYQYNETTSEWDLVEESTDAITYMFPVDTETATFTVSNFSTVAISNANMPGISELLGSINATLKLGTTTLISYSLTAQYYDTSSPKYIDEMLNIEGYKLALTLDLSNTELATFDASFKYNDSTIFAYGFKIDGDMDYDAVFAELDDDDISSNQSIVNAANAYYQIGNILVQGYINAANVITYYDVTYKDSDTQDGTEAAFMNDNIKLFISYADSKEVFAKGEFYTDSETDTYYDGNSTYTETYYYVDMKMVFTDGTAIDDSYFETGFSKIITEVNQLITSMNSNYDADMETM